MNNYWFLLLALTVTGLLLLRGRVMFQGRPVSHKRVFIIGFGNDDGSAGGLKDGWPSVIGVEGEAEAEAEDSPLYVGSETNNRLEARPQL